jgi:hypothetical protein
VLDPAASLLLRGALALLFAAAAWHKLRSPPRFRAILAAYRLLPESLVTPAALLVPCLEAAVAACLLAESTHRLAALAGALLLLGYAAAIGVNLVRGRRDLSCGCARDDRTPIAPWMIGRNVLLAAILALGAVPHGARPLQGTDAATLALGLAAFALIYLCAEQLAAHPGRMQRRAGGHP